MSPSRETHVADYFRLHTLGGLYLVAPDGEIVRQQRRRLALMALVGAAGDRGASRDKLIAWLSPESTTDAARHSLHQLLYYIRRQVGEDAFTGSDPLILNPVVISCDLVEFEAAVKARDLARAASLYKGPFLEGFHLPESPEFDEWASQERARLAAMHTDAILALASDATKRGDHRASAGWWRQLASVDPLSSTTALGLVRSLVASGDAPAALVHARHHEAAVRSELGSSPDPEFTAYVAGIHPLPPAAASRASAPPVVEHELAAGAREGARSSVETPAAPRRTRVWTTAGLFAAAAGGYLLLFSGNAAQSDAIVGSFSPDNQILVGDFAAASRDSLSARALSEALRSSLGASRAVSIVSRAEVDRALGKMQQPITAQLDQSLAHELALRNGYEGVLTGAITPIGTGYVLSARLTTVNGNEIATLSEPAASPDALIPAVGRLSKALRRAIGESASAIDSVRPLEQVTTASLRALQLYTQAVDESREGRGETAHTLGLLRQAIAHDSAFAMAHRYLGIKLYLVDSTQEALRELRLAERFSNRLTEIERLSALSTLHLVLRDYSRSADEAAGVRRLDPKSTWALNQLGLLANFLVRYEDGRQIAAERGRLDPSGRSHLVAASLYAGRHNDALAVARRFFDRYKHSTGSPSSAEARSGMGMVHSATAGFDSTEFYSVPRGTSDPGNKDRLASSQLARGQLRKAFATMGARTHGGESPTSRISATPESHAALAEIVMSSERLSSARRLDAVLADREYHRGNPANRRLSPVLALALAGRVADARRELAVIEKSSDSDVLVARFPELSLARGAVALAEGKLEQSIDFFRAASSSFSFGYDACRVCALPWLGRAYEAAGRNDSAVVVYERYLATGDPDRGGTDGLWLAVTLRRLGNLYAERGDTVMAIRRLEQFAALWSGADSVLQPQVSAARKRIADLRPIRVVAGPTPAAPQP